MFISFKHSGVSSTERPCQGRRCSARCQTAENLISLWKGFLQERSRWSSSLMEKVQQLLNHHRCRTENSLSLSSRCGDTEMCRGFVLMASFPCVFHEIPCSWVPAGLEQLELPPKAKTAEPDQDLGRKSCWSHWLSQELECDVGLAVSWHLQSGMVTNTLFFLHLRDPFHYFVWKIYYA